MSGEFIARLTQGIQRALDNGTQGGNGVEQPKKSAVDQPKKNGVAVAQATTDGDARVEEVERETSKGVVTTPEELEFFRVVQDICVKAGADPAAILYRDTINYFNVSYRKPTLWFVRLD
jgi:hypothetical protein